MVVAIHNSVNERAWSEVRMSGWVLLLMLVSEMGGLQIRNSVVFKVPLLKCDIRGDDLKHKPVEATCVARSLQFPFQRIPSQAFEVSCRIVRHARSLQFPFQLFLFRHFKLVAGL
jgi:hypothetical protein